MSQQLQDLCKFEEAVRNFKLSSSPSVRFIPQVLEDDDVGETMTLDLRLTLEAYQMTFKDGTIGKDKEKEKDKKTKHPAKVVEKAEKNTYKQRCRKLCHGLAEDYLKWARSLQDIFRGKHCTSPEAKFEMTGLMCYGNLKDTWEAIMNTHIGTLVRKTFKKGSE